MSLYKVVYSEEAVRQLQKIPKKFAAQIVKKLDTFAVNPRPNGYKKLDYYTEYFRFRIGNYRVIYQIDDKIRIVDIIEVKRRNESTY